MEEKTVGEITGRLAKQIYAKKYYQEHKEQHKASMQRYWENKAKKLMAEGVITDKDIQEASKK